MRPRLVLLRPRLDCRRSCQHAGGSDRSLSWSSREHREDSHSPCDRSHHLVLRPLSHPPGSLAQTRLDRSSPGPSPGTVTREERVEVRGDDLQCLPLNLEQGKISAVSRSCYLVVQLLTKEISLIPKLLLQVGCYGTDWFF